jgi:hypothetical protein
LIAALSARAAEALHKLLFRLALGVDLGPLNPWILGLTLGIRPRRISVEDLREFEARHGVKTHVFDEPHDEPFEEP